MDERDAQARIDAALVARALQHGGAGAFEQLVRRHQGLVRAQLRRLLGDDPALADDLAQETFVLAWRKLDQFRGESRFGTWLYRIAYSCFLQHLRRRGAGTPDPYAPDMDESAGAPGPGPDWGLDLDAAMRRLSTPQRAALLYCVQLDFTHEEAAVVLDMPLGSVKTHVARGKARLRQLLKDWPPETPPMAEHDPSHDPALDARLRREFPGPVPDDGFSARVMQALPARRSAHTWVLPVAAGAGGLLAWLALQPSPVWRQAAQEWLAGDLGAASAGVAVLVLVATLASCAWWLDEA